MDAGGRIVRRTDYLFVLLLGVWAAAFVKYLLMSFSP